MKKLQTTFITYSGQQVTRTRGYLSLLDVAIGLGRICRYGGESLRFWPVLLHSFVVADLLPAELEAHGLLHDMTDVLFGDIPKPFKLPETLRLQHRMHDRLLRGFGLAPLGPAHRAWVKTADTRAFIGERRILAPAGMAVNLAAADDDAAERRTLCYMRRYPRLADVVQAEGQAVVDFMTRVQRAVRRSIR